MEAVKFMNEEAQKAFDGFNFVICDEKLKTPENDDFLTETIEEQRLTEAACEKALKLFELQKKTKIPKLERELHVQHLLKTLNGLSHDAVSLEGSRTWLVYWCLNGLRILNHNIDHHLASKVIEFLKSCQKETGGFGGSPLHVAHLATTYASVMALISIGTVEAFAAINRKTLYDFLTSVKQPNGSFKMHNDGEIDVRGVYCATAVASITRIIDEKLFEGTASWLVTCQTFEGGFGAEPMVEAHGGYTFCAVASLAILGKLNMINIDRLMYWSANRQMQFEGGFQGRANKLVDTCYSYWMGAIFPVLDYELKILEKKRTGSLFDPEGLQAYILYMCQDIHGGLRDKPEKSPDSYHTCYGLAGLSIAQHYARDEKKEILGGEVNAVAEVNPLYNIVSFYHEFATKYFDEQNGN